MLYFFCFQQYQGVSLQGVSLQDRRTDGPTDRREVAVALAGRGPENPGMAPTEARQSPSIIYSLLLVLFIYHY